MRPKGHMQTGYVPSLNSKLYNDQERQEYCCDIPGLNLCFTLDLQQIEITWSFSFIFFFILLQMQFLKTCTHLPLPQNKINKQNKNKIK